MHNSSSRRWGGRRFSCHLYPLIQGMTFLETVRSLRGLSGDCIFPFSWDNQFKAILYLWVLWVQYIARYHLKQRSVSKKCGQDVCPLSPFST